MKRILKVGGSVLLVLIFVFALAFATFPLPGTIPVLMYHFVDTPERAKAEKNVVSTQSFAFQMAFLDFFNYRVLSIDEYYEIKTGRRPSKGREVLLTFDDGNYTFADNAYPVLQKHSLPAAIFVVSESVKRETNGSMSTETIKKLVTDKKITVSSHTKTHPALSTMTEEQIEEELAGSKQDLEEMFSVPIDYLSYPSGDIDQRVLDIAKASGYRLGFSTSYKKLKTLREGPYSLGRVKVTRTADNPFVFWFEISGIYHTFKREQHRLKNL